MLRNLGALSILIFENIRLSSQQDTPPEPEVPHFPPQLQKQAASRGKDEDRNLLLLLGACVPLKGYYIRYVPFNFYKTYLANKLQVRNDAKAFRFCKSKCHKNL